MGVAVLIHAAVDVVCYDPNLMVFVRAFFFWNNQVLVEAAACMSL